MIPFPPRAPLLVAPQRAQAPSAISAPHEIPCSLRRWCSISAPPQSLQSRIRPSAASQSPFSRPASACRAPLSSLLPVVRCPPAAPVTVPCPSPRRADPFPVGLRQPAAAAAPRIFVLALPQPVNRIVGGDAINPGGKVCVAGKLPQLLVGPQERLLHYFLG